MFATADSNNPHGESFENQKVFVLNNIKLNFTFNLILQQRNC